MGSQAQTELKEYGMQVRRVAGALGAEIVGVDLRDPDLDFDAIYGAF